MASCSDVYATSPNLKCQFKIFKSVDQTSLAGKGRSSALSRRDYLQVLNRTISH